MCLEQEQQEHKTRFKNTNLEIKKKKKERKKEKKKKTKPLSLKLTSPTSLRSKRDCLHMLKNMNKQKLKPRLQKHTPKSQERRI